MLVKSYKNKKDYKTNIMIDRQNNWNQSLLDSVSEYDQQYQLKKIGKRQVVCKERKIINMKSKQKQVKY